MKLRGLISLALATVVVVSACTKPDIRRSVADAGGVDDEKNPLDQDDESSDSDEGQPPSERVDAGLDARVAGGEEDDAGESCPDGFAKRGDGCVDIDECLTAGLCSVGSCNNEPGSFSCDCPAGYAETGTRRCTDVNECAVDPGRCGLAPCLNLDGTYACGSCPAGFVGNNGQCRWNLPRLAHLTVTGGLLDSPFDADAATYFVQRSGENESVSVIATLPADALGRGTIRVGGHMASSGEPSAAMALVPGDNRIVVRVDAESGAVKDYVLVVRRGWTYGTYFKASNSEGGDGFGNVVALSADGNTLAVGAPGEDSADSHINGDQRSDSAAESGAVYVFRRTPDGWAQEAYIKASNAGAGDGFGQALALTADGSQLAVGAPNENGKGTNVNSGLQADNSIPYAGAAYIFVRDAAGWSEVAYLKASNPGGVLQAPGGLRWGNGFGGRVAWSGDGTRLAVSAIGEGGPATGVGGLQTQSNSFAAAGAVYMFRKGAVAWEPDVYLKSLHTHADGRFGTAVALNNDGSLLAVGEPSIPRAGTIYTYTRLGEAWAAGATVQASAAAEGDRFGLAISMSSDGRTLAAGAPGDTSDATGIDPGAATTSLTAAGAAYAFEADGHGWSQRAYIKPSHTGQYFNFGWSLALSADGTTLVVGSSGDGSMSVLGGSQADSSTFVGAMYAFREVGPSWSQVAYVKSPSPRQGQRFGAAVAVSRDGRVLVSGTGSEASIATGINGDLHAPTEPDVGAAFLYE